MSRHNLPAARADFTRALQLDPYNMGAQYNLGLYCSQVRDFPCVVSAFKPFLAKASPQYRDEMPQAEYDLGMACAETKDIACVRSSLQAFVANTPSRVSSDGAAGGILSGSCLCAIAGCSLCAHCISILPRQGHSGDAECRSTGSIQPGHGMRSNPRHPMCADCISGFPVGCSSCLSKPGAAGAGESEGHAIIHRRMAALRRFIIE